MEIVRYRTRNFISGRQGHMPRGVVVHTTEGTFLAAALTFFQESSRVSAHYLVGLDGRVAQFVDETDTARHAGIVKNPTWLRVDAINPNLYTIGIEFEDGGDFHCKRTEEQYATGGELLGQIAVRWSIPLDRRHVVGHREINAAKTCPGNLDIDRLLDEARRRQ